MFNDIRFAARGLRVGKTRGRQRAVRHTIALTVVLALVLALAAGPFAVGYGATSQQLAGERAGVPSEPLRARFTLPVPAGDTLSASPEPADITPQSPTLLLDNGFETWPGPWQLYSLTDEDWGQTSYRASTGTYSAYCVGATIAAPSGYLDDLQTWIYAGPFDLSTYNEAVLAWDMWLKSEEDWDFLWAGASADGTSFDFMGWSGDSSGWVSGYQVDLADLYDDGSLDFTGDDSVWIAFVFGSDSSNTDEGAYIDDVTLTVNYTAPPNTAPVAVADSYSTDENVPLSVGAPGVLANDDDADGDPLTASVVNGFDHGTGTVNSNGSLSYTPAAGWYGTDSLTYRAYDGEAYSNTVSVTITVHQEDETLPPILYVAGADRFETAVEASLLAYDPGETDTVVIATGRNWPDALGGSALAGVLDAPILLTEPGFLPQVVLNEINRLGATRAVVLGGTSAVGSAVQTALQNAGMTVERIAGIDRYDTANQVARQVITQLGGGYDGTAFVATGGNFPDALAAAPLAAANGWPLYLCNPTTGISSATRTAMAGVSDAIILGGTAAVSSSVESNLGSWGFVTDRIAGDTRYDTAAQIAQYGVNAAGLMWNRVGIATGENYPDALAGGVLQGKVGSVMLLTLTDRLSNEAGYALLDSRSDISTVTFFGGANAVSDATRSDVADALAGTWEPYVPPAPEPTPTGIDGVWHGVQNGTSLQAVHFNVKNGIITTDGSTLDQGAALIVIYAYDNATITTYVYNDIPIVNGSFDYTWGTISLSGGQKHVEGTISSSTHATGSASHVEHSIFADASMEFDWTADR